MPQNDQYCPLQRKCGQTESHKSHLWCGVLIWGVKHLCKVSAPLEKLCNVELFQLYSGQRGFWAPKVHLPTLDQGEILGEHLIWFGRAPVILWEFTEILSFGNISKS